MPQIADEKIILDMIRSHEGYDGVTRRLAYFQAGGFSPVAFPLYARIMDDPKSEPRWVVAVLEILRDMPADRTQFRDRAVEKLAHPHSLVRLTAVELLGRVGTSRETVPVVALLADRKSWVAIAAAKTLFAIGDRRAVVAMNIWLNHGNLGENAASDEAVRKHVTKCRDELQAKLDEAGAVKKK